jgi:hypothetical protein
VLTEAERAQYRGSGWLLLERVFDADELRPVLDALAARFPSGDEYYGHPDSYEHLRRSTIAGAQMWPTRDLTLDLLPVHPRLVDIAEDLVGTADLALLRATYWAKYAGAADYDQALHLDYPNQSLVVPDDDEMVSFFLFLSDVTAADGPTKILPQPSGTPPTPDIPRYHRADSPDVYAREIDAVGPIGSVLAYGATVYHRGSALQGARAHRLSLTYAYGVPRPWTGHQSWPRLGEHPGTIAFLTAATPRQRELLGFPPVGDAYWTDEKVALVQRRYPDMDLSPYRERRPDAGSRGPAVS